MGITLTCPCRAINLDGTHRLLHLSVSDEVRLLLVQPGMLWLPLTSATVLLPAAGLSLTGVVCFFSGGHAVWAQDSSCARHCQMDRVLYSESALLHYSSKQQQKQKYQHR
jgi:hypothetical protein